MGNSYYVALPLCIQNRFLALRSGVFIFLIWTPWIPECQTSTLYLSALQVPTQPPDSLSRFQDKTRGPPKTAPAVGVMLLETQLLLTLMATKSLYCSSSILGDKVKLFPCVRSTCFISTKQQQRTIICSLECTLIKNEGHVHTGLRFSPGFASC